MMVSSAPARVPRICLEFYVSHVCRLMIRVLMILHQGLCTGLLAFALQLRRTPETSARRPSIKAVRPVIALNGVPYLQMRSVGSHSTSGRDKKEEKERIDPSEISK